MQNESDFPVSIDLAIAPPKEAAVMPAGKGVKNAKPVYPSLYLSNVEGLDQLPSEGQALIYFKRRSSTKTENDEGSSHSADLEIRELRLPAMSADEEQGELEGAMKGIAKERGIDVGETDEAEETPEHGAAETPDEEKIEDEEED